MKKTLLAATILWAGLFLTIYSTDCHAQDSATLLAQIESANSNAKIRKGNYTEDRKRRGKTPQSLAGVLVFDREAGTLSMTYSTPEGDYFNIADGFIMMKDGGVENKFDLTKNKPMKSLSDLLISSFSGTLQSFASQNACMINAENTASSLRVTVTATKKSVKGYSKVTVDYDPKTLLVMSMDMEEFDGSVTLYNMK